MSAPTPSISDIRREYTQGGLDRDDLTDDPINQFRVWLDKAIELNLSSDPTAMILATVDSDSRPSQRTVLLKGYDKNGFVFYTNYGSRKAREIEANGQVSLLFPWLQLERQVIVSGAAKKLSVGESTRYFLSRPHDSQLAAWASRQSEHVTSRALIEEAFAQMKRRFTSGEVPLPSFWGGYRVVPDSIEFWQGRVNRLHDRFLYQREDADWRIGRLQP